MRMGHDSARRSGARAARCARTSVRAHGNERCRGGRGIAVHKTTACGRRRRRRGDGGEATDSGIGGERRVVRRRGELQSLSCAADPIARVESVLDQGARSY